MSALSNRLAAIEAKKTSEVMYTAEGADFQEWALSMLDYKGSAAHKMIGSLVTAINNNVLTVKEARSQFVFALAK